MSVKLLPDTPIGELAIQWPALIGIFEKNDLDFCCCGQASLAAVCAQQNVAVAPVLVECQKVVSGAVDVDACDEPRGDLPVEDLIRLILERFHEGHRIAIDVIRPIMDKVAAHHGPDHPKLAHLGQLVNWLFEDLQMHMIKEEQVLFPLSLEAIAGKVAIGPCGSIRHPIAAMEEEHRHAYHLINEIRDLTDHYKPPEGVCRSFRALYANLEEFDGELRRHMHLENNALFTRLERLVSSSEATGC